MLVTGTASTHNAAPGAVQSTISQWKQGLGSLSESLQNGDLQGAQKAFDSLVDLHKSNNDRRPPHWGSSTLRSDFEALGKAIGSGDLSAAQGAFDTLHADLQTARQDFQSNHGGPQPSADEPDSDDALAAVTGTGTRVDLYA